MIKYNGFYNLLPDEEGLHGVERPLSELRAVAGLAGKQALITLNDKEY